MRAVEKIIDLIVIDKTVDAFIPACLFPARLCIRDVNKRLWNRIELLSSNDRELVLPGARIPIAQKNRVIPISITISSLTKCFLLFLHNSP